MKLDRILILVITVVVLVAAVAAVLKFSKVERPAAPLEPEPVAVSLIVAGVEGLEPSIIHRLSSEGRLPNLSRLMNEGAWGEFTNLGKNIDPRIPWTSLVTGMTPQNQGIGGMIESARGEMVRAPLVPERRTAETIWTMLGGIGESVGVIGWPATWPVEPVNGVMVGSYIQYILERGHSGDTSVGIFPSSAFDQLDPLFVDRRERTRKQLARFVDTESRMGLEALIGQNYESLAVSVGADESMLAIAKSVAARPGVRNLLVFLGGLNGVSQRFWHYMVPEAIERGEFLPEDRAMLEGQVEALGGTIDEYYEYVDGILGELLELLAEDGTFAVISDHGYIGITFDQTGVPQVGFHMHSEKGFCILMGPRVAGGAEVTGGGIVDVAPTILAAASLAVPDDLDGDVIGGFLRR